MHGLAVGRCNAPIRVLRISEIGMTSRIQDIREAEARGVRKALALLNEHPNFADPFYYGWIEDALSELAEKIVEDYK